MLEKRLLAQEVEWAPVQGSMSELVQVPEFLLTGADSEEHLDPSARKQPAG